MASYRSKPVWLIVAIAVGIVAALLCVMLFIGLPLGARFFSVDYSKLPPRDVFQRVCNEPVPSGVSGIRTSGNGLMQGHTVWMRFHATSAAIDVFVSRRGERALTAADFSSRTRFEDEGEPTRSEKRKVGWDEIATTDRPEFYNFDATHGGQGWFGVMAVDRKRGLVWVYAGVL